MGVDGVVSSTVKEENKPKKPIQYGRINANEHQEQCVFVKVIRLKYPTLLFYAIPNGQLRNPSIAKKLKNEGVMPGVPDLCFPSLKLYIEMKSKEGQISSAQRYMMRLLTNCGYTCKVCYGAQQAIDLIDSMMKPLQM